MCGIYFHHRYFSNVTLERENQSMLHLLSRGPDEQKSHLLNQYTFFGFTRLSIRSVVEGGQPFWVDPKSMFCINGELYNEDETRKNLELGHGIKTLPKGDMQLLGTHLKLNGMSAIKEARGMFAGFFLDLDANKVYLFRDRLGEKPLYYYKSEEELIVASDARCIQTTLGKHLDLQQAFLYSGIWPAPHTPFESIKQVLPGSWMLFELAKPTVEPVTELYWEWPFRSKKRNTKADIKLLSRKFESAVLKSVEESLISDVPSCLFLSGGLDSALVLHSIHDLAGKGFPSFTLSYGKSSHSEDNYASKTAELFHSNHTIIEVSFADLARDFESMLNAMDIPILDPACLPLYVLSNRTSKTFKVGITGDGGDELFMGYKIFDFLLPLKVFRYLRIPNTRLIHKLAKTFNTREESSYLTRKVLLERLLVSLTVEKRKIFETALSQFGGTQEIFELLNSRNDKFKPNDITKAHKVRLNRIELEQHFQNVVLPNLYLQKSDRMSMANSQELRSPLLDSKVIESAMSFSDFDLSRLGRKEVIRSILKQKLPAEVLNAPKHGFSVPLVGVLRELGAIEWGLDSIGLSPVLAKNVLAKALEGNENAARASFCLIVLNHFVSGSKFGL